jgi:hypothetical protein
MRRLSALLLLALFSLSLIGAAVSQPDEDAGTPACCRRLGKHHCAMKARQTQKPGGISVRTIGEKCPYSGWSATLTLHSHTTDIPVAQAFYANVVSHPTPQIQNEVRRRVSFHRSRQKRGPPARLS